MGIMRSVGSDGELSVGDNLVRNVHAAPAVEGQHMERDGRRHHGERARLLVHRGRLDPVAAQARPQHEGGAVSPQRQGVDAAHGAVLGRRHDGTVGGGERRELLRGGRPVAV